MSLLHGVGKSGIAAAKAISADVQSTSSSADLVPAISINICHALSASDSSDESFLCCLCLLYLLVFHIKFLESPLAAGAAAAASSTSSVTRSCYETSMSFQKNASPVVVHPSGVPARSSLPHCTYPCKPFDETWSRTEATTLF